MRNALAKTTTALPEPDAWVLLALTAEDWRPDPVPLSVLWARADERGLSRFDVRKILESFARRRWIDVLPSHVDPERDPHDFGDTRLRPTAAGHERARALRSTKQFNVRLPDDVRARLETIGAAWNTSSSAIAVVALREWLRMEAFPGIYFRSTPSGREAHVVGTGLTAWELHHMLESHGGDADALRANFPHLTRAQIDIARRYAEACPEEIPAGWGDIPEWLRPRGA